MSGRSEDAVEGGKPEPEYEIFCGMVESVEREKGRRECPGANSEWRGTRTGGSTGLSTLL